MGAGQDLRTSETSRCAGVLAHLAQRPIGCGPGQEKRMPVRRAGKGEECAHDKTVFHWNSVLGGGPDGRLDRSAGHGGGGLSGPRSEERRVGKEWVSTSRLRWGPSL